MNLYLNFSVSPFALAQCSLASCAHQNKIYRYKVELVSCKVCLVTFSSHIHKHSGLQTCLEAGRWYYPALSVSTCGYRHRLHADLLIHCYYDSTVIRQEGVCLKEQSGSHDDSWVTDLTLKFILNLGPLLCIFLQEVIVFTAALK